MLNTALLNTTPLNTAEDSDFWDLDVYLAPPATGRRRQRIALGGV